MNNDIDYVIRCLRWLANAFTEEYIEDTINSHLKKKMDRFYSSISSSIDWHELTRNDFIKLGFMCCGYEDTDEYELWLIPEWLYPIIPDGILLMDLKHNFFTFDRSCTPCEKFYGCMTYGFRITKDIV